MSEHPARITAAAASFERLSNRKAAKIAKLQAEIDSLDEKIAGKARILQDYAAKQIPAPVEGQKLPTYIRVGNVWVGRKRKLKAYILPDGKTYPSGHARVRDYNPIADNHLSADAPGICREYVNEIVAEVSTVKATTPKAQ